MAIIIDGKKVSAEIKNDIKQKTELLLKEKNVIPGLAVLLVGDNPASQSYVASKEKACAAVGFKSIKKTLPETATEKECLDIIYNWNNDDGIHGILVQLPLPKQINTQDILKAISPQKDVDGFLPENMGRLVIGLPGFIPCTPHGILELIRYYNIDTKGKHVVVVGRSNIVGKPIANLMYQKKEFANSIVTICHTAAKDISIYTRQADILIAAVGVPEFIKAGDVKDGVTVFDVGINRVPDSLSPKGYRMCGDVDFKGVEPKSTAITPVPGGIGPMTIAMLLKNTYLSAAKEIKF